MHTIRRPVSFSPTAVSIALVTSILLLPIAVAAQRQLALEGFLLPLPEGATASAARGIAERGWEPLTIVGTVETETQNENASCWIRVANVWSVHVLPGLVATGESWANAVDHVPAAEGEWTLVVGAATDASGAQRPMRWDNVTNQPWDGEALPTPLGAIGEAYGLFVPDATPLRAIVCGWTSEMLPTAAARGTMSTATHKKYPVVWEVRKAGVEMVNPDFGVGLEGVVNDGASSEDDVFIAIGGGQNAAGEWKPQLWKSTDDGRTWSNEEVPLPLGVQSGEVTDWDHEVGHWQGAGWGKSTADATVPLVWELDTSTATPTWIIHELPLPPLDEGGVNGFVHKRPGSAKYANIVLKQGINPEAGIWVDDLGGGWTLFEPADYLVNPEIGTPLAPAGMDKLGRVAVKFPWLGISAADPNANAQAGTIAGVLTPSPPSGIDDARSTPRLIAVTASPNPFKSGVQIGYTVPWDGFVTVTIHDVAGRVVTSLDRGHRAAGQERVVRWDGIARDGRGTASGVYFVRVETPHSASTLKIVKVD